MSNGVAEGMPPRVSKQDIQEAEYSYMNNGNGNDFENALHRARTTGAVSLSADLFEKLYLSPKTEVKGELRATFGNPTPIGLIGFLLSLNPLSCSLMGWRGASNTGAAGIPVYFFCGGVLMIIGGLLEWVLGNSFPSVVFLTFGTYWLSFGGTLSPSFAAYSSFAAEGEPASTGLQTRSFNASFGFFLVFMGVVCFIFLLGSLRTNLCFVGIFATLVTAFGLLTRAYWLLAEDYQGNAARATDIIVAGGAVLFATCLFGWYIFLAIILDIVDFPLSLPVGDLSRFLKPKTQAAPVQSTSEV